MATIKHYSVAIEGGWPIIRGPYKDYEVQAATIKAMNTENKRLSGKHAAEVYFLDIDSNGHPLMGKYQK